MVIYKFGGASVKDAASFRRLKNIISSEKSDLIVVVSAMGKTTNRLEEIVKFYWRNSPEYVMKISELKQFHMEIAQELMGNENNIREKIEGLFQMLKQQLEDNKGEDFNLFYDQVVSMGEILSTNLVSMFLQSEGLENEWMDIRKLLITDNNYRDAAVNLAESSRQLREYTERSNANIFITQGFIGSDQSGKTTTLGREGSDYTAALLASFFDAKKIILWKDVPGIFNADPALFKDVKRLERIHYQEMIELAYYGAKVIHPKTIKPLRTKEIPLSVQSFYTPEAPGTLIGNFPDEKRSIPCIIVKSDQVLISISLNDLSFINESHISTLFGLLNRFRLKANLMQHSAISFTICVDEPRGREVKDLISILRKEFKVLYNDQLNLLTIRSYSDESIRDNTKGPKIYVEQRSRTTVQYLTD
jgi:aspartate kinase